MAFPPAALTSAGREMLALVKTSVMGRLGNAWRGPTTRPTTALNLLLRSPEHFGQHCSNYVNMGLDAVAPLLDYHSAMAAIGLPPWSRFFYGWHRRVITAHCPRLAALPTADGFSALSEPARMLRDAGATGRPSCVGP